MKKLLAIIAIILATSESFAASATGTVRATVVDNIAVNQTTGLNFGSFTASGSSGTINQAGTTTGGVTAVSGGETRAAAVFNVTGNGSSAYSFTIPTGPVTMNSGINTMQVNLSFASGTTSRSLTSGSESVVINGVLNVGANQALGNYTGSYAVDVNY